MKITGKPYLAIRRRRRQQQFEHSRRILSSSSSQSLPLCSSAVLFSFCFFCFLSPCDEEQRTMLASPFEFGSRFLLCVWLAFLLWFSVCFALVFLPSVLAERQTKTMIYVGVVADKNFPSTSVS